MVKTNNLFGEEGEVKVEVSKEELQALKSYLYKTCRIGAWKQAMVAAEYLKRLTGEKEVLRTLLGLLTEDGDPDEVARIAPTIMGALQVGTWKAAHLFWHIVYLVATSRKWYETERGRELEEGRHIVKEKELPQIEFPSWVFDRHTAEGWRRIKEGKADLRLDGGWDNRWPLWNLHKDVTQGAADEKEARKKWVSHWFNAEEGAE